MDGSPTPESDPLSLLHDKSHAAPRSQWSYNTSEPPRRRTSSAMEVGAPDLANSAVVSQEPPPPPAASLRYLAVLSLAVVVLGVGDNIAYKVMLVPMEPYPYFVSEISSVLYCVVYFPILYWQSRVHNFSILAPVKRFWKFFLLVGFLDGVGDTTGLVAARHISGALLTLLPKERTVPFRVWVIIPMTMVASYFILKSTYSLKQIGAACLVLAGVGVALVPTIQDQHADSVDPASLQVFSALLYLASVAPSAVSFVVKELVFRREPGLNVFIVSFWGSLSELCFTILLLPLSAVPDFGHVPLKDLPNYFVAGAKCWLGLTVTPEAVAGDPCFGDPWAPFVYHSFNLTWNVALILLLAHGGATLMFITNTVKFPLANLLFGISWPLLRADKEAFSVFNIGGLIVEMCGVVAYNFLAHQRRTQALERERDKQRAPLLHEP